MTRLDKMSTEIGIHAVPWMAGCCRSKYFPLAFRWIIVGGQPACYL